MIRHITSVVGFLGTVQCLQYALQYVGYLNANDLKIESFPSKFPIMFLISSGLLLAGLISSLGDFHPVTSESTAFDEKWACSWESHFERSEFCSASSQRGTHIGHLLSRCLPDAPNYPD